VALPSLAMARLLLVVVLAAVAVGIAVVVQRRTRPSAPIRTGGAVPDHLERAEFARPDADWLVVLFSSATCLSCRGTWEKVAALESDAVATEDVEYSADRARHDRYGIDSVPLVVVADRAGEVRASFLGPPSAADLWASVADLREPGTVPPDCDHHGSV
jgi:Thioredoxin